MNRYSPQIRNEEKSKLVVDSDPSQRSSLVCNWPTTSYDQIIVWSLHIFHLTFPFMTLLVFSYVACTCRGKEIKWLANLSDNAMHWFHRNPLHSAYSQIQKDSDKERVICNIPLAILFFYRARSFSPPPPPSLLVTCHSPWSPPAFMPWYCHMNSKQCFCITCDLTEQDVAQRHASQRQNFWSRFPPTLCSRHVLWWFIKTECVFACWLLLGTVLVAPAVPSS